MMFLALKSARSIIRIAKMVFDDVSGAKIRLKQNKMRNKGRGS
jgi:hypothetical protein